MAITFSPQPILGSFNCRLHLDVRGTKRHLVFVDFALSVKGIVSFHAVRCKERCYTPSEFEEEFLLEKFRVYQTQLERFMMADLRMLDRAVSERRLRLADAICAQLPGIVLCIKAAPLILFRLQCLQQRWSEAIVLAIRLEEDANANTELAGFYYDYATHLRKRGHEEIANWFTLRGQRINQKQCSF